ncbi:MAG: coiled coil domain-containing protein [Gemmatimonadales bacterium]|nr:MAG: coiled coil domain-containing protein [Gemmatimonadales bacterium]
MDEERKKAYQDRFKARIAEWEAKLDQLSARIRRSEADLRVKLKDEESDLRKKLDSAKARLRELQEASGDGWDEIRAGADTLWTDLKDAWERTSKKAPPKDPQA